jgi:GxxExxY protein
MSIDVLTRTIIGCAYKVHNALGPGFLERVYENALQIELSKFGISAKQQEFISVWYDGHVIGDYQPDLWIADQLIVEVKAVQTLLKEHEVNLVHYLTATHVDNGLLINFGPSVQVKRKFREYRAKGSSNPVVWNS